MNPLSDLDAAILDFEETAPRSIGRKEEAIRAQLDISPVRYHQRLNRGAPRGEISQIVNPEY